VLDPEGKVQPVDGRGGLLVRWADVEYFTYQELQP